MQCNTAAGQDHQGLICGQGRGGGGTGGEVTPPPPRSVDLERGLLVSVALGSGANVKAPSRSSLLIYFMAPVSPSPSVPLSVSLVFSDRATLH